MKNITLLVAMQEELEPLLNMVDFSFGEKTQLHGFAITKCKYKSLNITAIMTGIGKVNAAVATTLACHHFQPDLVLNIGSSAGVEKSLKYGDVVVASELSYHDVDVTAFNYKMGQVPRMPASYFPCEKTLEFIKSSPDVTLGLVLAGDCFLNHEDKINSIKTHFPGVHAIDMESTAIAQACHHFQQPFLIVRSISDSGDSDAKKDHENQLNFSQRKAAKFLKDLLEKLDILRAIQEP